MKNLISTGLLLSLFTVPALVAYSEENVSIQPVHAITNQQENKLSNEANHVLNLISKTNGEIQHQQIEAAQADLKQSIALLESLKSSEPTAKLIDSIHNAKKDFSIKTTQQISEDLIPIESQITVVEETIPLPKARLHLNKAKQSLAAGHKTETQQQLDAMEQEVVYQVVDLPVTKTLKTLKLAQSDLLKHRTESASKLLKHSEDSLTVVTLVTQSPIMIANINIKKAQQHVKANQNDLVKQDLKNVDQSLDKMMVSADTNMKASLLDLKSDLKGLMKQVGKDEATTSANLQKFEQKLQSM